ncbi:MAG: YheC/YheD family protein [Firmicutes bacterium]|nr:YheC/YheD family protein [Bacillota bacterium]
MRIQQKIYARPVMGVLLNSESVSNLKKQIAKPWVQWLAEGNKEVNNTLYFFSLKDVNLQSKKINGYYWHQSNKRWLCQEFTLPDVLYLRSGLGKRYAQTFKRLCTIVTQNKGKLITHYTFNKWRLYEVLRQDPHMKRYLPATREVKQPDDIKEMLQDYKVVYLKSHIGRKGEQVLRVEVLPDGGYQCSYFRDEQLTVKTISDYQALLYDVNAFFKGKNYLIQQGIQLLKYDNRLIDMRAELQHNGEGGLDIVGVSVRCGQPGSPITTHGDAFQFEDFFVNKMGYSKEQVVAFRARVHTFLFDVYEYLENNYGKYAEIGIDFATDPNNRIWFIEANSRSTKVSLNKAYGNAALYRNSKTILEYAKYLYGRPQHGVKQPVINDIPRKRALPTQATTSLLHQRHSQRSRFNMLRQ